MTESSKESTEEIVTMNLRTAGCLQGDSQTKRGWASNNDRPPTHESLTTNQRT